MNDRLLRGTAAEGRIRFFIAATSSTAEEARKRHSLLPTSADALARVLTATALMSAASLKNPGDSLTLRVMGDGALGGMVAVGSPDGSVRGYVQNPSVYMPVETYGKYAFANAVGMGSLHVTLDLGLKEPYTGTIPLLSGEIASDISEYYAISEQVPSACGLGVLIGAGGDVEQSVGYLLQLMPGAPEDLAARLEENVLETGLLNDFFQDHDSLEELMDSLMRGLSPDPLGESEVRFRCSCSREKLKALLLSLGADELRSILEEQNRAEASCHFCANVYQFDSEELAGMIRSLEKGEAH